MLMVIQCDKCGNMIPVNPLETQRILFKIHSLENKLTGSRTRERIALIQQISTLRTVYRQMVHSLNELEKITSETPALYSDLRRYVLENGLMNKADLDRLTAQSKRTVCAKKAACEAEIKRLTTEFKKV